MTSSGDGVALWRSDTGLAISKSSTDDGPSARRLSLVRPLVLLLFFGLGAFGLGFLPGPRRFGVDWYTHGRLSRAVQFMHDGLAPSQRSFRPNITCIEYITATFFTSTLTAAEIAGYQCFFDALSPRVVSPGTRASHTLFASPGFSGGVFAITVVVGTATRDFFRQSTRHSKGSEGVSRPLSGRKHLTV